MPMLITFLIVLPVWPDHWPPRMRSENVGHFVQHGVDFGHDVFAVDQDRGPPRRPQGNVEHGAAIGDVDFVAAKHGVDPRRASPDSSASWTSSWSVSAVTRFLE